MKKLSNKGYVLVETLVVSAFVMVMFVLLYKNAIPLIGEYKKINNFDDTDSSFMANLYKDFVIKDAKYLRIAKEVSRTGYIDIGDCNKFSNVNLCQEIQSSLDISSKDKIIMSLSNTTKLKQDIDNNRFLTEDGYRGIKEYINYLNQSYNPETNKNKFIIIITRTAKNMTYELVNNKVEYKEVLVTKYGKVGIDYE